MARAERPLCNTNVHVQTSISVRLSLIMYKPPRPSLIRESQFSLSIFLLSPEFLYYPIYLPESLPWLSIFHPLKQTPTCLPIPPSKNCSSATSTLSNPFPLFSKLRHQLIITPRQHAANTSPLPYFSELRSVGLTPPHMLIRPLTHPPRLSPDSMLITP